MPWRRIGSTRRVDEIVARLLARPQAVLAHIRKLTQKPIIDQANLQYDLSWAYEHLDFIQHGLAGHFKIGWNPASPADAEPPTAGVGRPIEPYSEPHGR